MVKKIIRNNLQMLLCVWKHYKTIFGIAALFCVCDVITPFQDTYLPKLILDRLTGASSFRDMIPLILLFAAVSVYKVIIYPVYKNYFSPIAKTKISNALNLEMIKKTKELDLECFENEEFYNQYTRALNELDTRGYNVFESLVALVRYLIYMSVLAGIIVALDPILLFIGAVCAVFSFVCGKKGTKLEYSFKHNLTSTQRRCDYVKRILYIPEYAKETRFFPITDFLSAKYKKYSEQKVMLYKKNGKSLMSYAIASELVTTIILHGLVAGYLVWQIFYGTHTPGDFIALLLATSQFANQLAGLGDQINNFYSSSMYVENLNRIFEYHPKIEKKDIKTGEKASFSEIHLKDICFTYAGTDKMVLDHVNMKLKRGEKVAVVGLNGSGKSTLIKLLLKLYNPSNGKIELNGKDVRDYPAEEYRKLFGVIFQDFHTMAFTVGENIVLKEVDEDGYRNVRQALSKTGMLDKVEKLKLGIDTPITKEFSEDGVMFSGGEQQSIMLSRLYVKEYDVLILDEPASALDSYAEHQMYTQLFSGENENQTVLVISHRLPAVKAADIIYYMENGRIVEVGNHEQLMQLDGKYAKLYNIQNVYYSYGERDERGDIKRHSGC